MIVVIKKIVPYCTGCDGGKKEARRAMCMRNQAGGRKDGRGRKEGRKRRGVVQNVKFDSDENNECRIKRRVPCPELRVKWEMNSDQPQGAVALILGLVCNDVNLDQLKQFKQSGRGCQEKEGMTKERAGSGREGEGRGRKCYDGQSYETENNPTKTTGY
jgi:hypothetical protein